ncbi:MAG: DUF3631 domain-containing protein [Candidatus Sericytochromatia bacterium]
MQAATTEQAEQLSGAELLDALESWFVRFIAVTFDTDLALLALWTVHSHLAEECYTTPRLRLDSTMEGAGKTTTLEHLGRLCRNPIQVASLSSPALLPRLLDKTLRTVLLDEVDRTLAPDKPGVGELLAVVNSGYRVGAKRPVLVRTKGDDWEERELSTFAPLAMAGNAPSLPADTRSREIRVLLVPNLDDTLEDTDWEVIEDEAHALHDRIVVFADSVRDRVKGMRVTLPEGCIGRAKEKWRPLKRVAVAAGGRWPAVVDGLIAAAVAEEADERASGLRTLPPGVVLLTDLRAVWPADDEPAKGPVATKTLVDRLIGHNPDYWGEHSAYGKALTPQRFGKLSSQAAKAVSQRRDGHAPRGFFRDQFVPVWRQMGLEQTTNTADHIADIGNIGPDDAERADVADVGRSGPESLCTAADIGDDTALCARCGKPLPDLEAERRGICAACFLRSKRQEA